MAYRHITETDIAPRPDLAMDLQLRYFGRTGVTAESLQRFHTHAAAIAPYAGLVEEKNAPYTLVDGSISHTLVRAHTALWFLNAAEYAAFRAGKRTADLQPWQPGDGDAFAFVTFAVSQVPNGLARLLADLIDRVALHPAYPNLKEIFWFTRSSKGAMITNYVEAEELPERYTIQDASGANVHCPFFRVKCANGLPDMRDIIEKLMGIENNFARDVIASAR